MIVLKGTQTSLPPYFRCGKDIDWVYEFELPENGYDVGNTKEQEDWLKLIGVKPKFFDPMYDSKMVGFRWNLESRKYEFANYWHDKDKAKHFEYIDFFEDASINTNKVIISLHKKGNLLVIETKIDKYFHTRYYEDESTILYLINTFWGGTLNMQETLTWSMKKIK